MGARRAKRQGGRRDNDQIYRRSIVITASGLARDDGKGPLFLQI